jgi:hypothetical protein
MRKSQIQESDKDSKTEARHRFRLKGSLLIVTDFTFDELEECEDTLLLTSNGGDWQINDQKKVKDNSLIIADMVCVEFKELCPKAKYTLKVISPSGQKKNIFEDISYKELSTLSDNIDQSAKPPR